MRVTWSTMSLNTGCRANSCLSASSARNSADENSESIAAASGSNSGRKAVAALSAVSRRLAPGEDIRVGGNSPDVRVRQDPVGTVEARVIRRHVADRSSGGHGAHDTCVLLVRHQAGNRRPEIGIRAQLGNRQSQRCRQAGSRFERPQAERDAREAAPADCRTAAARLHRSRVAGSCRS